MTNPATTSSDIGSAVGLGALYIANVSILTGGWIADMNKSHIYNPRWTPHAKFHGGMTISMGTLMGAAGLYLLTARPFSDRANTTMAAVLPAIVYGAQASGFLYPGAKGIEAEAPEMAPKVKGVLINELPIALTGLAVAGLGYFLSRKKRR